MPVVPLAIMAGGAIISHYAAKKAKNDALKRTPEELQSLEAAQGGAGTLAGHGTEELQTGKETQAPATSYFDKLLHGNRAAQAQAIAAPTAGVQDVYRGAERGLEKSGVRGAARDVASGELARGKASQIAGLVTGVQPAAAQTLTGIGQTQQAQGAGMVSSSNSTYQNLLGKGQENRDQANVAGTNAAASVGQLATQAAGVYSDWNKGRKEAAG
jgi:hypothetical protein